MTERAREVMSEQYGQGGASVIAAAEPSHLTSSLEHQDCLSLTLSCNTTAAINLEIPIAARLSVTGRAVEAHLERTNDRLPFFRALRLVYPRICLFSLPRDGFQ
jgi:hypothetical protein